MRPRLILSALAAFATTAAVVATGGGALALPTETATTSPTTYYVDCSRSASGDGMSTSSPWNSLHAITDHGAFAPGDHILIKRGTTCSGRTAPTGSGTAGSPIVLGAYGSGALPTLRGGGTPNKTAVVMLVNVGYWTVQDLHITNRGASARTTSSYRGGVAVQNWGIGRVRGVTIQRLRIDNVVSNMNESGDDSREWGGIVGLTNGPGSGDGFDGLTIRNNVIDHVGRSGIMVSNHEYPRSSDRNVRVYSNKISWARGDSIVLRGSVNGRIDHNVSAYGADEWPCPNCGAINPRTANAGMWVSFSRSIRIDHNEVYGEHVLGGDGEAFDSDASTRDVVIEYNYAHDNQGGGILFCGSTNAIARFNILENNKKSAFAFIGNMPAKNTQIYNNTIYSSAKTKSRVVRYFNGAHGSKISFKNNLIYQMAPQYGTYWWPNKPSFSANTLIGYHGTGRPTDGRTSRVDPQLKKPGVGKNGMNTLKGYKPKHPSTFKRGVPIPSSVTVDFFGKKINPKKPPRGAAG